MIKKINFMGIPVQNQERALEFYTKKLGFEILADRPYQERQRWIELKIPGADTGLILYTPEGHEDRVGTFVNASFTVDSVEKTYSELVERGVEFEGPPTKEEWGSMAIMHDSEGNSLCLAGR